MEAKELISLLGNLWRKGEEIDARAATIKTLTEEYEALERQAVTAMAELFEETGGKSIDISDSRAASLRVSEKARILDAPKAHEWLREQGFGAVIQPYVNPQTFNKVVNEIAEKREKSVRDIINADGAEEVIDVYPKKSIVFRKK